MARRCLASLLALVALAAAAGCGGGDSGGQSSALPSLTSLDHVAVRTKQAGSYRFDLTMRMTVPGQPKAIEIEADGAVGQNGRSATMRVDFGSFADLLGGRATSRDDLTLDMVVDWPVAYMRAPFLAGQIPGGKEWLKVDLQAVARQQGVELPAVGSLGQSDPSAFLDFLRASGDLRTLGEEEIDGVRTTHYLARIDFAAWVERLPAEQRRQLRPALAQLEQLTQSGRVTPLVDAWVDGHSLLRRFAMTFTVPTGAQAAEVSMTMNLRDFGAQVDVSPPPADEITDLAQLTG